MRILLNQSKDAPEHAPKFDALGTATGINIQRNGDVEISLFTNEENGVRHLIFLSLMNEEKQDLILALAGGLFAKLHNLRKEWKSMGKKDPALFASSVDALIHELDDFERVRR